MSNIWKKVPNYPDFVEVSNCGEVRVLERTIVGKNKTSEFDILKPAMVKKQSINAKGYPYVQFRFNGFKKHTFVHSLVAMAFIPNPENKPQVNHKNGIKTDNAVSNLEWVTLSENQLHAYRTGLKKSIGVKGIDNNRSKAIIQKTKENIAIKTWGNSREVERVLGFSRSNILSVCNNKMKTAYGFMWEFNIKTTI